MAIKKEINFGRMFKSMTDEEMNEIISVLNQIDVFVSATKSGVYFRLIDEEVDGINCWYKEGPHLTYDVNILKYKTKNQYLISLRPTDRYGSEKEKNFSFTKISELKKISKLI